MKSQICSVAFAAYVLGDDPTKRVIGLSYSPDLATKSSIDCRVVMSSPWYRQLYPQTKLSRLKNTETEFATTQMGYRLATSIEGTLTGRGGDIIIVDDPLKPIDALSDSKRERVNNAFVNTILSRLDDKRTGAIIIVMQRLHEDDLVGRLLREAPGEWTVLSLPAIAEQEEEIEIGGPQPHVRHPGDVLHAEREPLSILESYRAQVGSDVFAAQYQQSPVPRGGVMIKRTWLRRYDRLPERNSSDYGDFRVGTPPARTANNQIIRSAQHGFITTKSTICWMSSASGLIIPHSRRVPSRSRNFTLQRRSWLRTQDLAVGLQRKCSR